MLKVALTALAYYFYIAHLLRVRTTMQNVHTITHSDTGGCLASFVKEQWSRHISMQPMKPSLHRARRLVNRKTNVPGINTCEFTYGAYYNVAAHVSKIHYDPERRNIRVSIVLPHNTRLSTSWRAWRLSCDNGPLSILARTTEKNNREEHVRNVHSNMDCMSSTDSLHCVDQPYWTPAKKHSSKMTTTSLSIPAHLFHRRDEFPWSGLNRAI